MQCTDIDKAHISFYKKRKIDWSLEAGRRPKRIFLCFVQFTSSALHTQLYGKKRCMVLCKIYLDWQIFSNQEILYIYLSIGLKLSKIRSSIILLLPCVSSC